MFKVLSMTLIVIVVAPAVGSPPAIPGVDRLPATAAVERGRVLIAELNCAACHDPGQLAGDAKPAPDLTRVGERVNPAYLERFIADPHAVKPGTTMPQVTAKLPKADRQQSAKAIAHFLRSLSDEPFAPQRADDPQAIARGQELFNTIGCAACHDPRNAQGVEQPLAGSVPLGQVHEKYSVDSLAAFLQDPLTVRAGGRMPSLSLSPWESRDLAMYLAQDARESVAAEPTDPALVERGRAAFATLGCANCHTVEGVQPVLNATPLARASRDRGCLANDHAVRYDLSDEQRDAIVAAMDAPDQPRSAQATINQTLAALNCLACHQRGDLGGIPADRLALFHTDNENLGEQGRIPPALTGVGAKLKPAALRRVLVSGESVRPYMATRMPQFGRDNVAPLVELFAAADGKLDAPPAIVHDDKDARKAFADQGMELVGDRGLNCAACHTFRGAKSAAMPAIDLTVMADRLQREWLHHYLIQPSRFEPSTVMPTFWPDGKAIQQEILEGDTHRQIEAIWTYLCDGVEARPPRGMVHEPLILAVGDEAVMLRRQYEGVGKRGIGVGYPAGVNLLFDAERIRLAAIWQGEFADAGGVWRAQGAGNVRPLGENHRNFPDGSAFALLDDLMDAWPDAPPRDMGIRFKGYTLDAKRRPTFNYVINDIAVTDAFIDVPGEKPSFRRTLTFHSPRKARLTMKLASGKSIVANQVGSYIIDDKLRLRIEGASRFAIIADERNELRIAIDLRQGETTVVIEYHW